MALALSWHARSAAWLFRALGDEVRLEVLARLRRSREPISAAELRARLDMPSARVARALHQLRKAGLVAGGRRGDGGSHYAIAPAHAGPLDAILGALSPATRAHAD